jgi:hypothetical protein
VHESQGESGDMNDAVESSDFDIEYLLLRKTKSSFRIRGSGECSECGIANTIRWIGKQE